GGGVAGQRVRRSVSRETAGAESEATHAAEVSAPGLLDLQQRIGNRATRALAHSHAAPPGTPPRPPARALIRETAPMHPLQRAWGATSESGVEQWDGSTGSKQWRRKSNGSGGYLYYYTVTSGSMDTEYEMEWHPESWFADNNVPVPPALLGTPSVSTVPVVEDVDSEDDDEEEWDVQKLFGEITRKQLNGICNAMTGAYLLDFLQPTARKTGLTQLAFDKTALLKQILDAIVMNYSTYDSSVVTLAFVKWAKSRSLDSEWLAGLNDSNVDAQFESFKKYFHTARTSLARASQVAIAGDYANMTLEGVYQKIDDMLEPWFSMTTGFQGVVVVKAAVKGTSGMSGHEMAIRYEPEGYVFEIFDQNTGLVKQAITEQEEIGEIVAGHIMKYVNQPMPVMVQSTRRTADSGRFEVQIHP
ncbi:MAG: hypothetical protein Q7K37_02265, partial [Dehalococcoidia bacterium]|nr:hypothetical protein [Dehalococcoidia bacterium]